MRLLDEVVWRCTLAVLALACMMLPFADRRNRWSEWSAEVQAIMNDPANGETPRRALEALRFAFGLLAAEDEPAKKGRVGGIGLLLTAVPFFVLSLTTRKLPAENLLTIAGDLLVAMWIVALLSRTDRASGPGKQEEL